LPGGKPFLTDSGNLILDCHFGRIDEPEELDEALKLIPGVVENGLFIGIADLAVIAGADGVTLIGSEEGDEVIRIE
jgi:ribose 5-phosphate isomerase A